jgi:hypothetical protein
VNYRQALETFRRLAARDPQRFTSAVDKLEHLIATIPAECTVPTSKVTNAPKN